MKPVILGSLGGLVFAAVILSAFVVIHGPVSVARTGGILVVTALVAGALALAIHGHENKQL